MPGRQFNTANYRYGFNGKENDNEVKGTGNQQDYGERIYDGRLGKFLSVDPLSSEYPWNSTYAFSECSPVRYIDLDGLEKFDFMTHLMLNANQPHLAVASYISDFITDVGQFDIKAGLQRQSRNNQQTYTDNGYSKSVPKELQKMRYTRDKYLANAQVALGFAKIFDKSATWNGIIAGGFEGVQAFANIAKGAKIHIDVGGYGKYPEAINFTTADKEMAAKIPNLIEGRAQETLLKVKSNMVDLVTIESAPYTKDISMQVIRVLKKGGQLEIKTPMTFDAAQYAKEYNLKLTSSYVITEGDVKYNVGIFKKK